MVSRQTCEVRRRLPHEVHFCAPKRNCLNCIMEARGVTTYVAPRSPHRRGGGFCMLIEHGYGLRGAIACTSAPLTAERPFLNHFADGRLRGLSRAPPAVTHVANSGIWP